MVIKKEGDRGQLEALRKVILAKLSSIEKKKFEENSIDEFSLAFRVFLLKYLNLDYEFTEEELLQELDRKKAGKAIRDRIIGLANLLDEIKYHGKKISKSEFDKTITDCCEIIKLATRVAEDNHQKQPEGTEKHGSLKLSASGALKNKIRNSIKNISFNFNFSALLGYLRQKKIKAKDKKESRSLKGLKRFKSLKSKEMPRGKKEKRN